MTDVRSLLRQQKAARRIDHPFAAYSDAGKLLCTLCREQLKAESLWDNHLLSQGHKQRLHQRSTSSTESAQDEPVASSGSAIHKRKHDSADTEDVEMRDAVRRKRSKPDIAPLTGVAFNGTPGAAAATAVSAQDKDAPRSGSTNTPDQVPSAGSNNSKESTRTPPGLIRRLSTTPSQGFELQIPSRPATPAHREGGSNSSASASGGYFSLQSQTGGPITPLHARTASATNITGAASATAALSAVAAASTAGKTSTTAPQVDESEWAAFEADIAAAEVPYDEGAVISAPAMTAEEAAAKEAADAENANRRAQVDVDIEDEKEEATRALEDEFAEMKELEARVKSLKEKREEIMKKRRESQSQELAPSKASLASAVKQNGLEETVAEDEEEDDDEDEEEDDWDGFRFRAA